MLLSLYYEEDSLLHHIYPGWKILFLLLLSSLLFAVSNLPFLLCALICVCVLFFVANIPFNLACKQIRPFFFLFLAVFMIQSFLSSWDHALAVVIRCVVLLLSASLMTLTTRLSALIACIEKALTPFSRWISVNKVSLMISLTLRFIPVLMIVTKQIKEAQRARGLERAAVSLILPLIIKVLKMSNEIAEAIDARS